MDGFTVRVEDAQVQETLRELQQRIGDTRDAMDAVGVDLLARIQKSYRQEQSPDGRAWKKLAPSTIRSRKRAGYWPGPILRVSGDLYRSITYQAGDGRVEIGSNWPYAAIHQFGGVIRRAARSQTLAFTGRGRFMSRAAASKRKKQAVPVRFAAIPAGAVTIPARPYLFTASGTLPDPWIAAVLGIIQRYLEVTS